MFTQTLGQRSPDVDKAIQEARSITEKLNKSADQIDSVLEGAENFLGSASGEAGKGAFEEIRAAAESVRELADNLNSAPTGILHPGRQPLHGFGPAGIRGPGRRRAAGRSSDISRAVRSIERNPQQFIFGGQSESPEYNGRR